MNSDNSVITVWVPHSKILSVVRELTFSPLQRLKGKKKKVKVVQGIFCSHQSYNNEHYSVFGLLCCPKLRDGIMLKVYVCMCVLLLRFVPLGSCMQVDFALFC